MDPRLLRYYNTELRYLREMGAEFAQAFPKIASRLGMEGLEVADPYVERLLEGSAFLAARVQLKLDAEFPQLSQRLLDMVCPNLAAPVPSMLIARFEPQRGPSLLSGTRLPRGTALTGGESAASPTRCEFRTAQEVVLSPISVTAAEYFVNAADLSLSSLPLKDRPRAGVRIRLSLPVGLSFSQLSLDSLRFYLDGQQDVAFKLQELVLGACGGVLVRDLSGAGSGSRTVLEADTVQPVGYGDDEALLPVTLRGLSGTRLMQEYFAFPQRFLFFDVNGLQAAWSSCSGNECELVILFKRQGEGIEGVVDAGNFALHCAPAINLFERRADRIAIDDSHFEFHVVSDRAAPEDFEVHAILDVQGISQSNETIQFYPLYATPHAAPRSHGAYWSAQRQPRLRSEKIRREGPRSGYVTSGVFLSLVDSREAPYADDMRQLSLKILATNGDLPLFMPTTGLSLKEAAPVESVNVAAGPSRPLSSVREANAAWQLINLLSLNHLSLLDTDQEQGAQALRELLGVFAQACDPSTRSQIDGVRHVALRPVVRRHPIPGPLAFGRGVEVSLHVDELAFEGASSFLLASVLHQYFARHAALNNFVQTSLISLTRGPLMCWSPRLGARGVV